MIQFQSWSSLCQRLDSRQLAQKTSAGGARKIKREARESTGGAISGAKLFPSPQKLDKLQLLWSVTQTRTGHNILKETIV